jgi:DNA gyrase/topoisomerase IV subunit A
MLNIQKEAEKNDITISDIIKNISKEKGQQENLSPELKFIKDNLSEAEQQAIVENIDKIRDLLADEEELPSKARALVGFIGELIYERYLKHTKQSYEFSADQGIGEYDFKIKSDDGKGDIYVDIKTNLYSFASGNIPFYLHSSQGAFLQKNPGARYHIVRISLKDLNLDAKYEEARYMDDKENLDPRQNPAVRAKCERIADNYWKQARISEFRGNSKEYMIRLEKPENE